MSAFGVAGCLSIWFLICNPKHPAADVLLGMLVLLMGFNLQAYQRQTQNARNLNPATEEQIFVAGWVTGEPVRQEKKMTFVLKTEMVQYRGKDDATQRRILTTLWTNGSTEDMTRLMCGTRVIVKGMLQPFPFPRNPGEFDYGRYLTLNDVQGLVTVNGPEDVVVTQAATVSNFNALVGVIQRKLYALIDRFYAAEHASFLKGVILGYRADLSTEMKQSFMNTGTIHILAVSGSNVAVVVLIIYAVLGFFRLPKKLTGFGTILGIVLFTFVTGASPSVVRAGIMATVILLGTMFERKADIYNSLSVAAIIILYLDTNSLFDVGFQLSFAAVLSIVYFYPLLVKLIALIPERFEEIKGIDYVLKLFAVSLAAQIGTLPFTAFYFGRVSIISLLANLIVVPLSGLNVLLGISTIAVSLFSAFAASCYAVLNSATMTFLLGFVKVAGNVPLAYVETARFEPLHALLYYGLVTIVFHLSHPVIVKWGVTACLVGINLFVLREALHHRAGILRLTVIDVGQGDAILLEMPNGGNVLVDAGQKQFKYDAAERTILPLLKRKGIKSLDAVVVTHAHSDHIGGVPYLVRNIHVNCLLEADVAVPATLSKEAKRMCVEEGVLTANLSSGDTISVDPAIRLYVLHPRKGSSPGSGLNYTSVVVKLLYGSTSILLVGDADNEAESELDAKYGSFLRSDILKVGHHGSRTSTGEEFAHTVSSKVSLLSVGTRNKFGHPSMMILDRLAALGSQVHRTDREGALVYESDGRQWQSIQWRTGTTQEVEAFAQ